MNIVTRNAKVKSAPVNFFPLHLANRENFDRHERPVRRLPDSLQALSGLARSSELFKGALAKTQLVSRCTYNSAAAEQYDAFALDALEERPTSKVWTIEASERWGLDEVLAAEPDTAQHIGLNPADGAFVRYITVDIDECFLSTEDALERVERHGIPLPLCIVRDRYTQHVHLIWLFAWDHKSPRARARVKRIRRAITNVVGGDTSFGGSLTKNPFARSADGAPLYDVAWTPGYEPPELDAFDDVLAAARDFKAASPGPEAGNGGKDPARRNCSLFDVAREWAYAEARAGTYNADSLLGFLREQNDFRIPLPKSEIRSIARSIDDFIVREYIPRFLRGGRRKNRGVLAEQVRGLSLRERQQIGQKYVAEKKHAAAVEKIRDAREAEPQATQAQIAKAAGVSLSTVKRRWKEASPQGVIRCSIRNGARDAGEQSPQGSVRGQGPARDDAESDAARSDATGLAKSDSKKSEKKHEREAGNIEIAIETQDEKLEARADEFTSHGIPKKLLKKFGRGHPAQDTYRVLDTLRAFGLYPATTASGPYEPAVKALKESVTWKKEAHAWCVARVRELRITDIRGLEFKPVPRKFRLYEALPEGEAGESIQRELVESLIDVELWASGRWIYVCHTDGTIATWLDGRREKPLRFERRTDGRLLPPNVAAVFDPGQKASHEPIGIEMLDRRLPRKKNESQNDYIKRAYPNGLFPDLAAAA